MCGICGAIAYRSATPPDTDALRRARDLMAARGPDGYGEWQSLDRRVWLGHRRLSIIELSDLGAQPMTSHDGRYVVTFNGEIYNFRALREQLVARGYEFRSHSDTEVLLELYRARGADFVRELRGMFAFALWDNADHTLLLARDPYGIKPLYYSDSAGTLSFASSVRSLVRSGVADHAMDAAGLAGFFVFGSVPEPFTLYSAIKALPAGSTLLVSGERVGTPKTYASVARVWAEAETRAAMFSPSGSQEAAEIARASLLDSVRHHLVADVPVGAFLSAGVDSGALVGLMRDAGQIEIDTITLTYDAFEGTVADEAPLAATTAKHYATRHHARRVSAAEFAEDLPKILAAMDQPSVDGVNTWFVSKAAREIGLKVAISGVGGDELLGGYDTFAKLPKLARWLKAPSRIAGLPALLRWAVVSGRSLGAPLHPKSAELLNYGRSLPGTYLLQRGLFLPDEAREAWSDPSFIEEGIGRLDAPALVERVVADGPRSPFAQVAALEASLYLRNQLLRDTDWASMAHSLEVRTPLVDHVLLERMAPLMLAQGRPAGKALLGQAPSSPLPDTIVNRRKTGFGIPIECWLDAASGDRKRQGQSEPFSRRWARMVADSQDIGSDYP
jgi:asparagine synthase (glutamine-hydrolysing)